MQVTVIHQILSKQEETGVISSIALTQVASVMHA
jgi:hypothetical protein